MAGSDAAVLAHAYAVLSLSPGVSPLTAKRRYRELMKQWHPDRHAPGSAMQAEATRRTQDIATAYQHIRRAALRREVPLRARPAGVTPTAAVTPLTVDTLSDRVLAGAVGLVVGLVVNFAVLADSPTVWIGLPITFAIFSAALGSRMVDAILRVMWWLA